MPRKRNPENKGLPLRWRKRGGAIYYQVPKGMEAHWDDKKEFRLGKSLPEAYRTWAERIGHMEQVRTIGQLLERYEREVIPTNAPKTQSEKIRYSVKLRAVFGDMPLPAIKPQHIYKYADMRTKKSGQSSARLEIALLKHAFTKAVEWGYLSRHPFKGEVRLKGSKPRTRYVEDWEVLACLTLPTKRKNDPTAMIQSYIKLKLLTGLRQGDLLALKIADLQEDGIHVTPRKTQSTTGRAMIIEWSDDLRGVIEEVKAARIVDISPYLFCTRRGEAYIASGWQSIWQRFMRRVLDETDLQERFTEHDLRAKAASDDESLEHASRLLAHADSKITERVYRRKAEKVKPFKRIE